MRKEGRRDEVRMEEGTLDKSAGGVFVVFKAS